MPTQKQKRNVAFMRRRKNLALKMHWCNQTYAKHFILATLGYNPKQELRNRKKIAHFSCTRFSYTHYMCCQNYKACMQERYLRKTMKIEQSFFSLSLLTKCVYARVDLCEVIREKDDDGGKKTISNSSHSHNTHFIQVVSYKNKNYDFDIIFSAKLKDTNVWNLIFKK